MSWWGKMVRDHVEGGFQYTAFSLGLKWNKNLPISDEVRAKSKIIVHNLLLK